MSRPRNIKFVLLSLWRWHCLSGAIALLGGGWTPASAFGQARQYIITELSAEEAHAVPCKLNNLGDIAGRVGGALEGKTHATVWNRSNFKSKHLATLLDGDYSSALDINDLGDVAGASNTGTGLIPFVWAAKEGANKIQLLPGDSCGQATAINKHGHIVGYSSGRTGAKAFLWERQTGVRNLGVLSGGSYSTARDINDSDEVVGRSGSANGERAVLWTKTGNVVDLGTLPGDWASEATAINNRGQIVGNSTGPRGTRAFFWSSGGGMEEVGVLPGGTSSRAMDINDRGEVVGSSTNASGDHAFVWTKRAGIVDLNNADVADLGFVFIEAHAINARGQILVMGASAHDAAMSAALALGDGEICAPAPPSSFLLTPAGQP
jgi:probable HAF family extracellular repeat protein